MQTLIDHLLDRARRVDLHRKEVVKAVYFCRFFRELLPECIREVVCGIGRLCEVCDDVCFCEMRVGASAY